MLRGILKQAAKTPETPLRVTVLGFKKKKHENMGGKKKIYILQSLLVDSAGTAGWGRGSVVCRERAHPASRMPSGKRSPDLTDQLLDP